MIEQYSFKWCHYEAEIIFLCMSCLEWQSKPNRTKQLRIQSSPLSVFETQPY